MGGLKRNSWAAVLALALVPGGTLAQSVDREALDRIAVDVDRIAAEARMLEASLAPMGAALAPMGASLASLGSLASLRAMAPMMAMEAMAPMPPMAAWSVAVPQVALTGRRGYATEAPGAWLQEDPGHRDYTRARELLSDRRYRQAARAFEELRERHPRSGYVADSFYWQAFALFREGGREDYERALALLSSQANRHPDARTRADADELRVRIEARMARRGDAQAAERIARQASQPCDEDQELRSAALSALLNMNADRAVPILREVLQSRDECSAELRRRAVFLVSQKMTDESVEILLDLAHRDPDPDREVREQAVFWLSQVRSREALDALAAILRETPDSELQEKAVFAISQHRSDEAMDLLRDYAERADADPEVRANAIFWIGQNGRAGGARYLRELYPRLDDPELKERVIFGVAQSRDEESSRWLLERAGDRGETLDVRKNALFWAGQSGAIGIERLRSLYASFTEKEMKEHIIFVASQRSGTESVDFLMEFAREETDTDLRKRALFWLGQSKDPRVAEFLLEILGSRGTVNR